MRLAADESRCINSTCSKRDVCKRWTDLPHEHQVFSRFMPVNGVCEFFIPIYELPDIGVIEK